MRSLVRLRYAALSLWAVLWALPGYRTYAGRLNDYSNFMWSGLAMLGRQPKYHGGALHVYAQYPGFQFGPPPALLAAALTFVTNESIAIWAGLIIICGLVTVRAGERLAVTVGVAEDRAAMLALTSGAVLLAVWGSFDRYFHLEDAFAVAAVACAMALVARRAPWWAPAVLLGTATACKPWAVVAVPLLLAGSSRVKALAVFVVSAAVWWLPFVIADHSTISALASAHSDIDYGGSALHALGRGSLDHLPRVLSLAAGVAAGVAVVRQRMWMAVPLVAFTVRLLLEPRYHLYYAVGPVAAALLWDMARGRRVPVFTLTAAAVTAVPEAVAPPSVAGAAQVVFAAALLLMLAVERRQARTATAGATPSAGELTTVSV